MKFSPFKENALVSCGVKQITFWTLIGNTLKKEKGIFGKIKEIQTMFCLAFSSEKDVHYAGTMNGQIMVWKANKLDEIIPVSEGSSIFAISSLSDGFVTGGKDGTIRTWDTNFNPIEVIDLKVLVSQIDSADSFLSGGIIVLKIQNYDYCYELF